MGTRQKARRRPLRWAWVIPGLCLLACLGLVIDFATDYRSFVSRAGEWQFARLGRYYPAATITLTVLLALIPLSLLALFISRERRRRQGELAREQVADEPVEQDPIARVIVSTRHSNRFFGILSVVLAFSAFGALIIAARAPTSEGPIRVIEVAGAPGTAQGHARYASPTYIGRIARIYENVAFASRTLWVAPVYAAGKEGPALYWTEVIPTDRPSRFRRIESGVFVRGGLPPEVEPLYRSIGITVPDAAGLLMLDSARPRWRMTALAVQVGVVSLLSLAIALILRRQLKKLRARKWRSGQGTSALSHA